MKVDDVQTRYHGRRGSACSSVAGVPEHGAGLEESTMAKVANRVEQGRQKLIALARVQCRVQ